MTSVAEELFTQSAALLKRVLESAKMQGLQSIDLDFIKSIAESDDVIKGSVLKELITMHVYYDV